MRRNCLLNCANCVVLVFGLLVAFATGASAAGKEKVIYSFQGGSDGAYPYSDLATDADGNLYGTTSGGGCSQGCGTVFELMRTKDGWKEQVLYRFTGGSDGSGPQTGLTFDSVGNLYGTTPSTVFELSPNGHGGWTLNTLNNSANWFLPAGDLAFDAQGNLYGAASEGGSGGKSCDEDGCGAVFELAPQVDGSWTETTIHVFQPNSSDGVIPSSGVVLDAAGDVYGMTLWGGTGACRGRAFAGIPGCGTIYELKPGSRGSWTETILYDFDRGCGSGVYPSGGVLFDEAGHVLGTSQVGGNGLGTVLELRNTQRSGWQQGILHRFFGPPDGDFPVGRLVEDARGDLFGVAYYGGANRDGTVFQMHHSKEGWKEQILHSFGGAGDGANPQAGLVFDKNGRLYGTTGYGGSGTACGWRGCGTVYEITP